MRLVVFGPGHPFRGGIPRATTGLVLALGRAGHEVHFLSALSQYPRVLFPGRDDRDPETCERIPGAEPLLGPLDPTTWPRTRRRALELAADAWLVPYWTWAWAGCWRFLLGGSVPPAVAVVHNPEDHGAGAVQRLAARLVLTRCDGLFTHAERLREILADRYPAVPTGAHPLPAEAPARLPGRRESRARLGLGERDRVALFWGLVRPYKGVDVLVEAAALLGEATDWRIVVAGEAWGGLDRELERRAADLGLGDRVRFRFGWVDEGEVAELLAAADVVVLPYRSGSQSAVAPIALAHGLPVVSTTVGGLSEVVEDGVSGLLVPPGSPEALAGALQRLDRSSLARLSAGALAAARGLTWDGYAVAVTALLDEVAAGRG